MTAVLLISSFALAATSIAAEPRKLSDLARGEVVQVTFKSRGCFHSDKRSITIRRLDSFVAEISPPGAEGNGPGGLVPLTQEDVTRLDNLLTFYRSDTAGGCTTVERIAVRWPSPWYSPDRETFENRSCVDEEDSLILSFWALIRRTLELSASNVRLQRPAAEPARRELISFWQGTQMLEVADPPGRWAA